MVEEECASKSSDSAPRETESERVPEADGAAEDEVDDDERGGAALLAVLRRLSRSFSSSLATLMMRSLPAATGTTRRRADCAPPTLELRFLGLAGDGLGTAAAFCLLGGVATTTGGATKAGEADGSCVLAGAAGIAETGVASAPLRCMTGARHAKERHALRAE